MIFKSHGISAYKSGFPIPKNPRVFQKPPGFRKVPKNPEKQKNLKHPQSKNNVKKLFFKNLKTISGIIWDFGIFLEVNPNPGDPGFFGLLLSGFLGEKKRFGNWDPKKSHLKATFG